MAKHDEHEVYRGHLDECVKHLAGRLANYHPKHSKGLSTVRAPIATFCGVHLKTVKIWLQDARTLPIGITRIKLMCFLDLQGYRVIELVRMKQGRRGLLELIGYGLLTQEAAAQLLGYKNTQNVLRILFGSEGTTEEKDSRMWDAWKQRKEALEEAKAQARIHLLMPELTAAPSPPIAGEGAPTTPTLSMSNALVLAIMAGLLRFLDESGFHKLPPEQLQQLHRVGGATILRLSSHLSELSAKLVAREARRRGGPS